MSGSSASTPTLASYTVQDLVLLALRQIGIGAQGNTPGSTDTADGLMHLNMMLAQWQRRRWLVPTLVDLSVVSTGAVTQTIGPNGDIVAINRPDKIEYAFARYLANGATVTTHVGEFDPSEFDPSQFDVYGLNGLETGPLAIDYPLQLIDSYEDYARLSIKNLRTFPCAIFYSPEYPVGLLKVWPIPAAGLWEIHVICKQQLQSGVALTDTISLPPEYWDAIMWNLAARMAPSYGQEAPPTVQQMARAAMQTIRTANARVPSLLLPGDLMSTAGGSIPAAYVAAGFA